jgi:hypothetical protein
LLVEDNKLKQKGGYKVFNGLDKTGKEKFFEINGKLCNDCKPIDKNQYCLKKEHGIDFDFYSESNCDIHLGLQKLTSQSNVKLNNRAFQIDNTRSLI